jgi:hypothetical protein
VIKKLLSSFYQTFSDFFSGTQSHDLDRESTHNATSHTELVLEQQHDVSEVFVLNQSGLVDIQIKMSGAKQPHGLTKVIKLLQWQSLKLND